MNTTYSYLSHRSIALCECAGRLAYAFRCGAFVVLLLGGPWAVAEDFRLWSDSTGRFQRKGAFEKLDGETVFLRTPDGSSLKVPLSRLSEADQKYAREAAAGTISSDDPFAVDKAAGDRPLVNGPARPSAGSTSAVPEATPDDPTLKKVLAEGVGKDVDKAKQNAYREAVRQVVGAYVDAESQLFNRKLIEDRITLLSAAYVERSEEPEVEKTDEGLVRVRLIAYVRKTKVLDVLRENKVAVRVDNDSLVAEMTTKTDQREAQQDLMSRVFRGYPAPCFSVTVEGQPRIEKTSTESSSLAVRLRVRPNVEAFRKYSEDLHAALSATDRAAGSFASDGKTAHPRFSADYMMENELFDDPSDPDGLLSIFPLNEQQRLYQAVSGKSVCKSLDIPNFFTLWNGADYGAGVQNLEYGQWSKMRDKQERNKQTVILVVLSKAMANCQRTSWRWYALSPDEAKQWLPPAFRKTKISLVAKDSSGNEVLEDVFELSRMGWQSRFRDGWIYTLAPFYTSEYFFWYIPEFTYHRLIPASAEEIAQVKTLSCTVEDGEKEERVPGLTE